MSATYRENPSLTPDCTILYFLKHEDSGSNSLREMLHVQIFGMDFWNNRIGTENVALRPQKKVLVIGRHVIWPNYPSGAYIQTL